MTPQHTNETETITRKATRMALARKKHRQSAWYGLGMFGLVGWSVAVPIVAGTALGLWIDRRWPAETSWTLVFMLVGVALGCLNAWYWIQREGRDD
ncbi:AtpZ/AtpI family protein [Yoonia sp.]|uniref:AtpZ/AtpI family protein n=1 Tax=Yoonia sp. TaxID=2212373 RepID=UPI0019FC8153|nr:AtpZ/AtpI family protein [Yoonia sp.]MBE0413957.1 AtpZ/AtpI family protein [Yoonia sp.]